MAKNSSLMSDKIGYKLPRTFWPDIFKYLKIAGLRISRQYHHSDILDIFGQESDPLKVFKLIKAWFDENSPREFLDELI